MRTNGLCTLILPTDFIKKVVIRYGIINKKRNRYKYIFIYVATFNKSFFIK